MKRGGGGVCDILFNPHKARSLSSLDARSPAPLCRYSPVRTPRCTKTTVKGRFLPKMATAAAKHKQLFFLFGGSLAAAAAAAAAAGGVAAAASLT